MLNEVFLDVLKSKDAKLSKLKDSNFAKILSEATSSWVPYEPEVKGRKIGGDQKAVEAWNQLLAFKQVAKESSESYVPSGYLQGDIDRKVKTAHIGHD